MTDRLPEPRGGYPGDTVAAVSTPHGEGAVAMVRLTGPAAVAVADAVFRGRRPLASAPARTLELGRVVDASGETVDQVMAARFDAPASFTGEAMVEFTCHGGILVTRRLLELLFERGARPAGPGEFTQRAFLNGKIDLTQAEGVMDLIRARTELSLKAAASQLEGRLGAAVRGVRDLLLDLVAHVEAHIDFPEEDIEPETGEAMRRSLEAARGRIAELAGTADRGRVLRHGLRTVICGPPNAGKSSLLNFLLGFERAIVAEEPGTTRDTIEETVDIGGLPVVLVDTAGLRDAPGPVEREGVQRALRGIADADLALRVADASQPPPAGPPAEARCAREILVLNKCDLPEHPGWAGADAARVSCRTGEGMAGLAERIVAEGMGGAGAGSAAAAVAVGARHRDCLRRAIEACDAAALALERGEPPELVAVGLRGALAAVGEITGETGPEEILDRVFATFCIGK